MTVAVTAAVLMVAYKSFGEPGLVLAAVIAPLICFTHQWAKPTGIGTVSYRGAVQINRSDLIEVTQSILDAELVTGRTTACVLLSIDDYDVMNERLGMRAVEEINRRVNERLFTALRQNDVVGTFGDGKHGIVLASSARIDLESILQIAARVQQAIAEPIILNGTHVHLTVSLGFAQPERIKGVTGESLLEAAEVALRDAQNHGPGSVRAYSAEMHRMRVQQSRLIEEMRDALELGHIRPWFQPQISTDTGQVTGFEALARWVHPDRGLISPGEFLPAAETGGLLERLGEVMLFHSLTALKAWDRTEFHIPNVGVNFAADELRNPSLVDKVAWELDRFDLEPERVTVEVLENVIADGAEDIVSRNITGLCQLGCGVDLDDFGTGHSSITNIRRFAVSRLKIDRSFVMRVDTDQEQQRMVAAILTMAERLDLETLAEGVETVGEHTMLAQLGCGHVQGFGIGKPMPFEDTLEWLSKHNSKLVAPPKIG